ncbi:hypothetical protein FQZ97_1045410 [compost metagenome]
MSENCNFIGIENATGRLDHCPYTHVEICIVAIKPVRRIDNILRSFHLGQKHSISPDFSRGSHVSLTPFSIGCIDPHNALKTNFRMLGKMCGQRITRSNFCFRRNGIFQIVDHAICCKRQ